MASKLFILAIISLLLFNSYAVRLRNTMNLQLTNKEEGEGEATTESSNEAQTAVNPKALTFQRLAVAPPTNQSSASPAFEAEAEETESGNNIEPTAVFNPTLKPLILAANNTEGASGSQNEAVPTIAPTAIQNPQVVTINHEEAGEGGNSTVAPVNFQSSNPPAQVLTASNGKTINPGGPIINKTIINPGGPIINATNVNPGGPIINKTTVNPGGPIINTTNVNPGGPIINKTTVNPGGPIINATSSPTPTVISTGTVNPGGPIILTGTSTPTGTVNPGGPIIVTGTTGTVNPGGPIIVTGTSTPTATVNPGGPIIVTGTTGTVNPGGPIIVTGTSTPSTSTTPTTKTLTENATVCGVHPTHCSSTRHLVCGVDSSHHLKTYRNQCYACKNKATEYYFEGACPSGYQVSSIHKTHPISTTNPNTITEVVYSSTPNQGFAIGTPIEILGGSNNLGTTGGNFVISGTSNQAVTGNGLNFLGIPI